MDDILKKIDELIDKTNYELYKAGLEDAKDIILSQQKELATDNNVVTKSGKDNNVLTIGDKIRENNESLAEYISKFTILADRQRIIDYLNQPYMEQLAK